MSERIVVAMSGGVDSSYVAALLASQGHEVVGMSMRLYEDPNKTPDKTCCSPDDLLEARSVAARFDFPFYVVNYQEQFREKIIDYFVDEYRRGRTPSPCVMCNNHLKFDTLIERTMRVNASKLATGHYARIVERNGSYALLRGVDAKKDQSYFLFGIPREHLNKIMFPLGGMTKDVVRERANELEVPTANKPESQNICFIGGGSYAEFVKQRLGDDVIKGEMRLLETNETLGTHDGIHNFTLGQRKGLGISHTAPLYVHRIDPDTGTVWVTKNAKSGRDRFVVSRTNWLRWEVPPQRFECTVQIRSRAKDVPCSVEFVNGEYVVSLADASHFVTPGQAAVFYDEEEVLGGGWIE
jgi:tRNA-specific 2-thiouridylase